MTLDRINIPIELFSLPLKGKYEMVIIALAYSFSDKGLRISNGKLAKVLHTSSRTIERVIARLRKNGFLTDANNVENRRCLKINTDILSGVYTDIKPVSATDTMPGGGTDMRGGNYRHDVAKYRHDVGHKLIKLSKEETTKEKPVCDEKKVSSGNTTEPNRCYLEFEQARQLFPGTKRGLETEFANFKKKYKNWQDIIPLLEAAIGQQKRTIWVNTEPQYIPHFQTWINNRGWELEQGGTPPVPFDAESAAQRATDLSAQQEKMVEGI